MEARNAYAPMRTGFAGDACTPANETADGTTWRRPLGGVRTGSRLYISRTDVYILVHNQGDQKLLFNIKRQLKFLREFLRGEFKILWKLIVCSLVFMAGKSTTDAMFIVRQLCRRSIWQGIKSFGCLLWIWRKLLTGSPGGVLVGFEMFGCRWMDSVSVKTMYMRMLQRRWRVNGRESKVMNGMVRNLEMLTFETCF